MANDEHVALLKQGVDAWNAWRKENSGIHPDLSKANLIQANLSEANLSGANLNEADLGLAILIKADLSGANLSGANLSGAILIGANLSRADLGSAIVIKADLGGTNLSGAILSGAILIGANFSYANLSGANLSGANLHTAVLVNSDLSGADLTGCRIYGVSAWRLKLERAKQQNLIITDFDEPTVTVDNIEVAQFIYLMLNNQKVRDVIDTITSKAVLILGRFTHNRKAVLDCVSVTTYRSCSTSMFQPRGILPRPSHYWPAWPGSS
jgi:hypothetical protein